MRNKVYIYGNYTLQKLKHFVIKSINLVYKLLAITNLLRLYKM